MRKTALYPLIALILAAAAACTPGSQGDTPTSTGGGMD